jgi:hypothetical protein
MYLICRYYLKENNKHKPNVILKLFAHLSIKTYLVYNGYKVEQNTSWNVKARQQPKRYNRRLPVEKF